ncbi:hypothetical protein AMTR_s00108p00099500 [Amborella trichopoda]|uniref:Uncharacterized protein n=1 Tax=Amborella trichopoda TaxID=13333 RepID=W1NQV7_AMBTC|nr:hypothetical protein AMTR_s00108p00099500 [Amborella trichopoda]
MYASRTLKGEYDGELGDFIICALEMLDIIGQARSSTPIFPKYNTNNSSLSWSKSLLQAGIMPTERYMYYAAYNIAMNVSYDMLAREDLRKVRV